MAINVTPLHASADESIIDALRNARVVDFELDRVAGWLVVEEMCDGYFANGLFKGEVARLIAELQALHDQMAD